MGGGVYVGGGTVTFTDSTLSDNKAQGAIGGTGGGGGQGGKGGAGGKRGLGADRRAAAGVVHLTRRMCSPPCRSQPELATAARAVPAAMVAQRGGGASVGRVVRRAMVDSGPEAGYS